MQDSALLDLCGQSIKPAHQIRITVRLLYRLLYRLLLGSLCDDGDLLRRVASSCQCDNISCFHAFPP